MAIKSKATSQNQSQLFYTGAEILYRKAILSQLTPSNGISRPVSAFVHIVTAEIFPAEEFLVGTSGPKVQVEF